MEGVLEVYSRPRILSCVWTKSPYSESHQRLLSWADMFDTASPAEKKMIASCLIKAVILSRDCGIQVDLNVFEAQYLGGMEMG